MSGKHHFSIVRMLQSLRAGGGCMEAGCFELGRGGSSLWESFLALVLLA